MMGKICLIIQREYLVRVRKKSFLIMTILAPLLMAGLIIIPAVLTLENKEKRMIAVYEEEGLISNQLENSTWIDFITIYKQEAMNLKSFFPEESYYALLEISRNTYTLYSNQQIALSTSTSIKEKIEHILEKEYLKEQGISLDVINDATTDIELNTKIISKNGEATESSAKASMGIGFISGILIYIFIFMYGTMVMRGVIEEKSSRIIEVIISSVKPFELMMGKIIGVALVGLTQFVLWIILTLALSSMAEAFFMSDLINSVQSKEQSLLISELNNIFGGINIIQIIISFINIWYIFIFW